MMQDNVPPLLPLRAEVREVLARFPLITLAVLFGSAAAGALRPDSDIDVAVGAHRALSPAEKLAVTQALAGRTGRPVDLVDLATVPEPLLGQVVQHGAVVVGSDTDFARLVTRHLIEQADFVPYQQRLVAERRKAWIGR